ncbi:MAG: hypothetical protein M3M98_05775 [Nitrospirota bacterium]|nr:hypothetical protein [Nitrospirota bacterium]
MPQFGTDTSDQTGKFSCATSAQRTLKDLRTKRRGQPVFVVGHRLERKGKEATFEVFNDRLAIILFEDDVRLGYDPLELLLPTEIDEQGIAYFEIRPCRRCEHLFPLTADECDAKDEPTLCPECASEIEPAQS